MSSFYLYLTLWKGISVLFVKNCRMLLATLRFVACRPSYTSRCCDLFTILRLLSERSRSRTWSFRLTSTWHHSYSHLTHRVWSVTLYQKTCMSCAASSSIKAQVHITGIMKLRFTIRGKYLWINQWFYCPPYLSSGSAQKWYQFNDEIVTPLNSFHRKDENGSIVNAKSDAKCVMLSVLICSSPDKNCVKRQTCEKGQARFKSTSCWRQWRWRSTFSVSSSSFPCHSL